jgi:UDP-N-acetylglucosamine 2-epimerase
LIGNSSAGIRESNFLGLPVINIGRRQEGRERGENVIDWNFDSEESLLELISKFTKNDFSSGNVYGVGDAGKQISKILMEVELISLKRFQKRPLAE